MGVRAYNRFSAPRGTHYPQPECMASSREILSIGPLGFALTLQPIIERIYQGGGSQLEDQCLVPGRRDPVWFSKINDLLKVLKILEEDGPARGLHLNHAKSLLFIPNDGDSSCNPLPSDIPTTSEGFNLQLVPPLSARPQC